MFNKLKIFLYKLKKSFSRVFGGSGNDYNISFSRVSANSGPSNVSLPTPGEDETRDRFYSAIDNTISRVPNKNTLPFNPSTLYFPFTTKKKKKRKNKQKREQGSKATITGKNVKEKGDKKLSDTGFTLEGNVAAKKKQIGATVSEMLLKFSQQDSQNKNSNKEKNNKKDKKRERTPSF